MDLKSADKNIVDKRRKLSASSSAVRDARTRLTSVGNGLVAYEADLLQGFARNQINAGFAMPCLAILVAAVSFPWVGWVPALLWAIVTTFSYLLLGALSARFLKEENFDTNLPAWRRKFLFGQLLVALSWVTFALFSTVQGIDYQYSIIQFSTMIVFLAATAMLSYAFGQSVLVMTAPGTLILSIQFLLTYETPIVIMGLIMVMAILFFYMIAERFKRSLITMLEHATEKETLIVELETAKAFSEDARSRAEEANLAKSRFLATMSHELRTPLNAILGFSEMITKEMMGPIGNDTYKEYVHDIHNSGSHLLKLINEILDLSRIEAGKHEIDEQEVHLTGIVEEACHMMNIKAKQKGITLSSNFEEGLPAIVADERALHQIVLNLISNALKFTPSGGNIDVKVGWTRLGGQYIIVKDNGPGIPEEEIPLVLSSFGQGAIAIQNAEPGTGLGLSIVQALLHLHQGRFELKSQLRQGTEAICYLPETRICSSQPTKTSSLASESA